MRVRTAVAVTSMITAAVLSTGLPQAASAAVATTTTVTAKNPLGNTPGKLVMTAKVRPTAGAGVPTGSCTFAVDTTVVGTKALNSRGGCSLTTHVKLGSHTVKISYGGSTTFAASSGSTTIDVTQ
jgi:hypothetical protein